MPLTSTPPVGSQLSTNAPRPPDAEAAAPEVHPADDTVADEEDEEDEDAGGPLLGGLVLPPAAAAADMRRSCVVEDTWMRPEVGFGDKQLERKACN